MFSLLLDMGCDLALYDGSFTDDLADESGQLEELEMLRKWPILLSTPDHQQFSLLHSAARQGQIPLRNLLLSLGADINWTSDSRINAVQVAAYHGHIEVIDFLLSHGADPSPPGTPVTLLEVATMRGHVNTIAHLQGRGMDLSARGAENATCLHVAAQLSSLPVVDYLVEQQPDLLWQTDIFHRTALHRALMDGHLDTARYLITKGLSLHFPGPNGQSALHLVVSRAMDGDIRATIEFMLAEGVLLEAHDDEGRAPLHLTSAPCTPITQKLIDLGHSILVRDLLGRLPLHYAWPRYDVFEVSNSLLPSPDSDPLSFLDSFGMNSLLQFINDGDAELHTCSEYAEEDDYAKVDVFGRNGLMLACNRGDIDIFSSVSRNTIDLLNSADYQGRTHLHFALLAGEVKIVEKLPPAALSPLNADNYGRSLYWYALQGGSSSILELLKAQGVPADDYFEPDAFDIF